MIKRRNPILRKRATPRRGALRDAEYREFLREDGICAACAPATTIYLIIYQERRIRGSELYSLQRFCDPCHTENNGMRSKGPDSSCAPLCRIHHQEYDAGRAAFERKYGIDMKAVAKAWWELYQRRHK